MKNLYFVDEEPFFLMKINDLYPLDIISNFFDEFYYLFFEKNNKIVKIPFVIDSFKTKIGKTNILVNKKIFDTVCKKHLEEIEKDSISEQITKILFLYDNLLFLNKPEQIRLYHIIIDILKNKNFIESLDKFKSDQSKIFQKITLFKQMFPHLKMFKKNFEKDFSLVLFFENISEITINDYKNHSLNSANIIKKYNFFNEDIFLGICHHHEYLDGSGSLNLSGKIIHEYGLLSSLINDYIECKIKDLYKKELSLKYHKSHIEALKKTIVT